MTKLTALFSMALSLLVAIQAVAQTPPADAAAKAAATEASLPPATKLEGFKPAAGSVVTVGYDNLPEMPWGTSVDVRELRDSKGDTVRGLVVEVTQGQYRQERAFVDADEIPELLKGLDAITSVKDNPTAFGKFEVRYETRGGLQLTAYNSKPGKIEYAVRVGRVTTAQHVGYSAEDMAKLRTAFEAGLSKISSLGPSK